MSNIRMWVFIDLARDVIVTSIAVKDTNKKISFIRAYSLCLLIISNQSGSMSLMGQINSSFIVVDFFLFWCVAHHTVRLILGVCASNLSMHKIGVCLLSWGIKDINTFDLTHPIRH